MPGIILAFIVYFTMKEPARGHSDGQYLSASTLSLNEVLVLLKSCQSYVFLLAIFTLNGLLQYGLNQWFASFYVRSFNLDLTAIGLYLGVALGGGSAIGILLGGSVTSRLAAYDAMLPLKCCAVVMALSFPVGLGILLVLSLIHI